MPFDAFLASAWNDHGDRPPDVADRLAASLRIVTAPEHVAPYAGIVTHVFGEHLGEWDRGARLLEALRGQAPGDSAGIGVFELFTYLSKHIPADATTIDYEGKPLVQEPLLYAHQLDSNIALALRPGWQGGTLDADLATMIEELAQAEIELASYAREADAPAELRAKRDALLARIEAGG